VLGIAQTRKTTAPPSMVSADDSRSKVPRRLEQAETKEIERCMKNLAAEDGFGPPTRGIWKQPDPSNYRRPSPIYPEPLTPNRL